MRVQGGRAADETDSTVAGPDQPANSFGCSLEVREHHGVCDEIVSRPVDADDRGAELALTLEVGLVGGDRHHHQRPHTLLEEGLHNALFARRIVIRRGKDHHEAVTGEFPFDASGDKKIERVREVTDHEGDGVRHTAMAQVGLTPASRPTSARVARDWA